MKKNVLLTSILLLAFLVSGTIALAQNNKTESHQLFESKCAMCHGADGSGNTFIGKADKIPDLHSSVVQKKTDQQLSNVIENGKRQMPPFGKKLTPEQIEGLVSYVRALGTNSTSIRK